MRTYTDGSPRCRVLDGLTSEPDRCRCPECCQILAQRQDEADRLGVPYSGPRRFDPATDPEGRRFAS